MFQTNKNLGPSVSEQQKYIQDVLETHLLNDSKYEHLPPAKAKLELRKQKKQFLDIYGNLSHLLPSEAEQTYFKRVMSLDHLSQTRVPQI
jgi:hypothetical protein